MQHSMYVNLGKLVLSISDTMDLASPLLAQHQQRTAFIVWEMAKLAGISSERAENCFIAALLHDLGAFSLEEKIALHNSEVADTEIHCIRGKLLLENVPWLKGAAMIVRTHHDPWQRRGGPIDSPFVFESQMLHLADCLERLIDRNRHILLQNSDIMTELRALSGTFFHPAVIDLISGVSDREEFWLDLVSSRLYYNLLTSGPCREINAEIPEMIMLAELFRNIIDFRSRFTATHSAGVAAAASIISRIFGLTASETSLMEFAGNLHDIGKLVIPNSILEKQGKLNREEFAFMKSHTYFTYSILNTIGLQEIAEWAAYHHEKINGSGYPFKCSGDKLSTGSRIMCVADIFTALAEERPYRRSMSRNEIIHIMKQSVEHNFVDGGIVEILLENYDEIHSYVNEKQAQARRFYEQQFAFIEKRGTYHAKTEAWTHLYTAD